MSDFSKLTVWQEAHALALELYRSTAGFPGSERFGITGQIQRAAISVPANIAEGSGRSSKADYIRFCYNSAGSLNELEYHLLLARDLKYLPEDQHRQLDRQLRTVRRLLTRFIQSLQRD